MNEVDAEILFENGRSHLLSAALLYESSVEFAKENEIEDPEHFGFNGTFSLSLFYLAGLGMELFLKAAYIYHGGDANERHLRREIDHDIVGALDFAEARGFCSRAPNLRAILEHLREPLLNHSFRYVRPNEMDLPDPLHVLVAAQALDDELRPLFWGED